MKLYWGCYKYIELNILINFYFDICYLLINFLNYIIVWIKLLLDRNPGTTTRCAKKEESQLVNIIGFLLMRTWFQEEKYYGSTSNE